MNNSVLRVALVAVLLIVSAVAAVTVQHLRRESFSELRELEHHRDRLESEWGRLQLEESTWGNHDRIERLARQRLGLHAPNASAIVVVSQ